MTTTLKPCRFTFDWGPVWPGFAHGSTWNGFDNVAIDLATRHSILEWMQSEGMVEDADGLAAIEAMPDGLFSLGWGYSTQIVTPEDENDILRLAQVPA